MTTRLPRASSAFKATKTARISLSNRIQNPSQSATFVTSLNLAQTQPRFHQLPNRRTFCTSQSLQSTLPKYSHRIAASFVGKDGSLNLSKDGSLNYSKNVYNFNPLEQIQAHRDAQDKSKRPESGQDAFFVSKMGQSNDVALGVCDGVGGWADSGVDPADFSHGICGYMSAAAYDPPPPSRSRKGWTAQTLLQRGYEDICDDPRVRAGGSTACVAIAKSTGDLEVANLGDSGFMQIRLNAIHAQSEPQTHAFNTPYQLSLIPANIRTRAEAFGGYQLHDMPHDAVVTKHELRHGDVVILATDGVWDNLSHLSILQTVSRLMVGTKAWEHTSKGIRVGEHLDTFTNFPRKENSEDADSLRFSAPSLQNLIAASIAAEAKAASINTLIDSPFAREVQKYYPEEVYRGGKVDDICVVVIVAVEQGK